MYGLNWLSSSREEVFKNFVHVFSLFRNSLTLEKCVALHLNKFEFPVQRNALCLVEIEAVFF